MLAVRIYVYMCTHTHTHTHTNPPFGLWRELCLSSIKRRQAGKMFCIDYECLMCVCMCVCVFGLLVIRLTGRDPGSVLVTAVPLGERVFTQQAVYTMPANRREKRSRKHTIMSNNWNRFYQITLIRALRWALARSFASRLWRSGRLRRLIRGKD